MGMLCFISPMARVMTSPMFISMLVCMLLTCCSFSLAAAMATSKGGSVGSGVGAGVGSGVGTAVTAAVSLAAVSLEPAVAGVSAAFTFMQAARPRTISSASRIEIDFFMVFSFIISV